MTDNNHIGSRLSPSKRMVGSATQLKCIYCNAHDNKEEIWKPLHRRKTITDIITERG